MEQFISFMMAVLMIAVPITKHDRIVCDHWFIKHTNNHEKPVCDRQFEYINTYDAYYVDPNADHEHRVIYLTFDAGYENGNIAKILDVMKEEQVPGAFFILDNMIYRNSDLLERMANEGHLVCNHTAKHGDMSRADEITFKSELKKMEQLYLERTGRELSKFYRPPEGKFVEKNLQWAQDMGYVTVLWSFAYPDWDNQKQPDPVKTKEKIIANTHPGEIILMHPTSETNAIILCDLIKEWKNMGYSFGSLEQLSKYNG